MRGGFGDDQARLRSRRPRSLLLNRQRKEASQVQTTQGSRLLLLVLQGTPTRTARNQPSRRRPPPERIMRPSLVVRWTRAVPLTAVPATSLRLPPSNGRPKPKSVDDAASPTVDRLLNSLERSAARLQRQGVSPAPRPAGNTTGEAHGDASLNRLPPNLRINEFAPRRKVYQGVKASHRDLVSDPPSLRKCQPTLCIDWLSSLTAATIATRGMRSAGRLARKSAEKERLLRGVGGPLHNTVLPAGVERYGRGFAWWPDGTGWSLVTWFPLHYDSKDPPCSSQQLSLEIRFSLYAIRAGCSFRQ